MDASGRALLVQLQDRRAPMRLVRVLPVGRGDAQLAAQRRGNSEGAPPPLQPRENGGVREDGGGDGVVLV